MTGENGSLVALGEIGGNIDMSVIYANLAKQNSDQAKGMWNPFAFRNLVKSGGEWDLKNNMNTIWGLANHTKDLQTAFLFGGNKMEAQDVGNHHFGVVGKAFGLFSEEYMLRKAGEAQIAAGTSRPEWQIYKTEIFVAPGPVTYQRRVMLAPYGDDPRDQRWIRTGFTYYKKVLR